MRYRGLDLNLLYTLNSLLETRSVGRVADQLGLSQSAISAALKRLRDHFGDELLVLDGRRMHPTAFAEQLAQPIRDYLTAADAVIEASRTFDPAGSRRSFRIIASDYVVMALLANVSRRLAKLAPGVRLDFASPGLATSQQFLQGKIDLCISPREYLSPDHPTEPLYQDEFVLAGWRENPLFAGALSRDAFVAAEHVVVTIGSDRALTFADRQLSSRIDRRIVGEAQSFASVAWMLFGTQRVAVMHRRLATALAQDLPLAYAPLPFEFPPMVEMAQCYRTRASDAGLRWLIDIMRETAEGDQRN